MEFKDKQSIYLQIADYICEQILLAKWPPGERIPSVRDLASMMEVNPNTVMRTYEFLQTKEIIFNKRGIGYSASENATALILAYRKERFLENELPEFFKAMYLINISMEELQSRYQTFVAEVYPEHFN
ncbi:GntR family transcriptional regulator [Dyadobacter sp. CY312]|uniref:GntR family transcriptional regulator n=1 Tax=Dyadobacter sp. CY312 TaxID=2907303 RepID=UPI001F270287|nr:GntR family transcriptional regulator [Dyadobacter sp. CY312]MCE7040949.1 GntR family transcriptional regulator [Dyadobacter sp. CY312]